MKSLWILIILLTIVFSGCSFIPQDPSEEISRHLDKITNEVENRIQEILDESGKLIRDFLNDKFTPRPLPTPIFTPNKPVVKSYEYAKMDKIAKQISEAIDSTNPTVRNLAVKLASRYPGELNVFQAVEIYKYVKNKWKYVNDPRGRDYFARASETIHNGFAGDCDDFAILISALLESIGATTRIVLTDNHAYAEVLTSYSAIKQLSTYQTIYYHRDERGRYWLSLDWTARYPGGKPMGEARYVVYPDGTWIKVTEK
ncbi:MAG: transglutaminase domain-containing protein [Archaeoglobus sp.]|nr:transglutaminase domain-containing protein [Archaeoglobus sp.]